MILHAKRGKEDTAHKKSKEEMDYNNIKRKKAYLAPWNKFSQKENVKR